MKMTLTSQFKKGFTLIELLVVIAILATLAGISYPVVMGQINSANETAARKTCLDIVQGVTQFQQDYGSLPYQTDMCEVGEDNNYQVAISTTDGNDAGLVAILTNREEGDDRLNTNRQTYLRSDEQDKKADGLYVDPTSGALGLYDPWGNPYYIIMCDDEEIGTIDPFTGKKVRNKICLVYSLGADSAGKPSASPAAAAAASEEEADAQEDNIYSWKKR